MTGWMDGRWVALRGSLLSVAVCSMAGDNWYASSSRSSVSAAYIVPSRLSRYLTSSARCMGFLRRMRVGYTVAILAFCNRCTCLTLMALLTRRTSPLSLPPRPLGMEVLAGHSCLSSHNQTPQAPPSMDHSPDPFQFDWCCDTPALTALRFSQSILRVFLPCIKSMAHCYW